MEVNNLKLEKSFVNTKLVQTSVDEFHTLLKSAQIDVEAIRKYFVLRTLEDVQRFADSQYIRDFLDKGFTEYIGKTFTPPSELRRISDEYEKVFKDTADKADALGNFFKVYPFEYKYDGLTLAVADEKEVRRFFEKRYIRTLTDEDMEYFDKFANVMRALEDCAQWEVKHTYVNFTKTGDVLHPLDNNIFTIWQSGHFDGEMFAQMLGGGLGKIMHHEEQDED
jgi:hypothetical protein